MWVGWFIQVKLRRTWRMRCAKFTGRITLSTPQLRESWFYRVRQKVRFALDGPDIVPNGNAMHACKPPIVTKERWFVGQDDPLSIDIPWQACASIQKDPRSLRGNYQPWDYDSEEDGIALWQGSSLDRSLGPGTRRWYFLVGLFFFFLFE